MLLNTFLMINYETQCHEDLLSIILIVIGVEIRC